MKSPHVMFKAIQHLISKPMAWAAIGSNYELFLQGAFDYVGILNSGNNSNFEYTSHTLKLH